MTARITRRRTIAISTATIGNSLMGLFEAKSVVVAANCFSAGCKKSNKGLSFTQYLTYCLKSSTKLKLLFSFYVFQVSSPFMRNTRFHSSNFNLNVFYRVSYFEKKLLFQEEQLKSSFSCSLYFLIYAHHNNKLQKASRAHKVCHKNPLLCSFSLLDS